MHFIDLRTKRALLVGALAFIGCEHKAKPPTVESNGCLVKLITPEGRLADSDQKCQGPTDGKRFAVVLPDHFAVSFDRDKVPVGSTVNLATTDSVALLGIDKGRSCNAWKGTLTFSSDLPHWQVVVSAECREDSTFHFFANLAWLRQPSKLH